MRSRKENAVRECGARCKWEKSCEYLELTEGVGLEIARSRTGHKLKRPKTGQCAHSQGAHAPIMIACVGTRRRGARDFSEPHPKFWSTTAQRISDFDCSLR